MPELPAWVDKTSAEEGNVWVPAVTAHDDGYLLYFTAPSASQHVQCIGVARARAPHGLFHSIGLDPLVCQPGDADAIDPKPFTDTDGRQYLLYSASREGNTNVRGRAGLERPRPSRDWLRGVTGKTARV